MSIWMQLLAVVLMMYMAYILYRYIKQNPTALSKDNLLKSFSTMGFLALMLIALIAFCVFLLRQ